MHTVTKRVSVCFSVSLSAHYLVRYAPRVDEQQVFQVGVEQRTVDHGDPQPVLHNEAHRAVIRETD